MIYYMNSKTFFDVFLDHEDDSDILNAYYICISSHIRRRDTDVDNVLALTSMLYPNTQVFSKGTFKEMKEEYFKQLEDEGVVFLANMIRGSIKENKNIIFICSKNEWKLKYLKWLAQFCYCYFEYPIYEYESFINGCGIIEYDKKKVLKQIKPIIQEAEEESRKRQAKSKLGRRRIMKEYEGMSKKQLKKIIIKEELYTDGMSKDEMLDMLEVFL